MDPTYPTEVIENMPTTAKYPFSPENESKFASLMLESEAEEEEEDPPETLLFDGPYVAPLTPHSIPLPVVKLIASLPEEIQPLITPLPAAIQTSFKMGVMKTQMFIELPSSEKVEIVIDQYDTNPTAYHISFYGSETTNDLISQKQTALLSLLQKALPHFSFALSPPFLETPSFLLPKSKRLGYSPVNKGKHKK